MLATTSKLDNVLGQALNERFWMHNKLLKLNDKRTFSLVTESESGKHSIEKVSCKKSFGKVLISFIGFNLKQWRFQDKACHNSQWENIQHSKELLQITSITNFHLLNSLRYNFHDVGTSDPNMMIQW